MVNDCAICCDTLKRPVSIPCGHIFCHKCINNYVNSATTLAATCPTCHEEFEVVTPDLSLLQEKYHKFVIPSIRRVFIAESKSALEKRIKQLEKQLRAARAGEQPKEDNTEHKKLVEKHANLESSYATLQESLNTCQDSLDCITAEKEELERKYQDALRAVEQARTAQRDLWSQNCLLVKDNTQLTSWSATQANELSLYKKMAAELKQEVVALRDLAHNRNPVSSVVQTHPIPNQQVHTTYYESYDTTQYYTTVPQLPTLYTPAPQLQGSNHYDA